MPYIGRGSDNGFSIRNRYIFTATANQQNFSGADANSNTLALEDGFLTDVFVNGIMLKPTTDYTLNNSTNTLSLVSAADANEEVTILVYQIFALSDAMPTSGGTFSGALTNNSTTTFNDDVTFTGANYNVVWDKSDNALEFADDAKLTFGAGADLTIRHDSSNNSSFIEETGSANLRILADDLYIQNQAGNKTGAIFFDSGKVELRHNNSTKFETSSTGATVTGTLTATTLAGTLSTAAQANITSVGTLTSLTSSGDVTARNSSTTGTTLTLGTTSASVSNGGYIGGLMFTAGSANSGTARIQALSNGQTDAGATGTGADFSFECRDNNQSFTEKVRFTGDGKVGIGTSSPDAKLDVEGTTDAEARITRTTATTAGTFNDAGSVLNLVNNVNYENGYNGGASIGQILFTSNDSSTGTGVRAKISCKATTYYHAERLQFFVSPPNTASGQVSATSNTDGLRMEINDDGTVKIGVDLQPTAWGLRVYTTPGNSSHASIEARNNTTGGFVFKGLNHNGSLSSSISQGGVGYFPSGVSSDETLKNVKGVMNDGWSKLKDVQPKSFTWKKITTETNEKGEEVEVKSDDDLDGNIHYGVMAQDLKKVIPELAYGEEGGMSVDYNGLLMVAINTIKELEARIKALEEA